MRPVKVTRRRFVPEPPSDCNAFYRATGSEGGTMPALSNAKILIIATHGFEDSELLEPRKRLLAAGAEVVLASSETGQIKGEHGALMTPDRAIDEIAERDFDGLLIPGGVKNPDKLRTVE